MRQTKSLRILANAGTLFGAMALTIFLGLALYSPARAAPAFDPNAQPVGYVAMPEVTSHLVSGGGQVLFAIDYSAQTWAGNLHAYPISASGQVTTSDFWGGGAAGVLDAQNFDTSRKLFTAGGVPFRWSNLTADQRGYLGDATTGPKVLDFLRGDRSNEVPLGSLRTRASVLGDIIHSTPVYYSYGASATVFVGANDGMLHAFDASTGAERFAYIPATLLPRLSTLSAVGYNSAHEYFVDGNLAIRPFTVGSATKVILAGALGAGGKALYALDVTAPDLSSESSASSVALWEVSSATSGFANLGYTYAAPVLATLPGGTPAVVVGNGYNNTGNGQASLFVINAVTGGLIAEIGTGSGSAASPNGLSSPRVLDTNADGYADTAYAGDLDGHLWKFDLVAHTATLLETTSPAQAITMAPAVKVHPDGGYLVDFVTGRMLTTADASDTSTHYAYGIWDGAPPSNTTLVTQTLTATTYGTATPVRTATATTPDWTVGHDRGWKTPLPTGGERVVGDGAVVQGGTLLFLSSNPTANPGSSPAGENWWMQINAETGGDNGAVYFDLSGDGYYSADDEVSVGPDLVAPVGKQVGGGVRSQFIVLTAASSDVLHASYDINSAVPPAATAPTTADPGVSGGHFDFDIFYPECAPLATSTVGGQSFTYLKRCLHTHEYDDIFDVTGVDMLNASRTGYNLSNTGVVQVASTSSSSTTNATYTYQVQTGTTTTVVSSTPTTTVKKVVTVALTNRYRRNGTRYYDYRTTTTMVTETTSQVGFKVLAANQAYSPAAKLSVGGNPYVAITAFGTAPSLDVATLPTYTLSTIGSLAVNLPLDAFKVKDWAGTGDLRVGLQPTQPNCMYGNPPKFYAPENAWRNGSLVVQVIRADTPQSALELNVAGRPDLGWRIKPNVASMQYLIAEYVMFWHHPNNACYGDSTWVKTPPQDPVSDAVAQTPAPGSTDPKDGLFNVVSGGTGTGTGTGDPSTSDGTSTGTGTGTSTSTSPGTTEGVGFGGDSVDATNGLATPGTVSVVNGENKSKEKLGRASWRMLLN